MEPSIENLNSAIPERFKQSMVSGVCLGDNNISILSDLNRFILSDLNRSILSD